MGEDSPAVPGRRSLVVLKLFQLLESLLDDEIMNMIVMDLAKVWIEKLNFIIAILSYKIL